MSDEQELELYLVNDYVFENKEDYEMALHEKKAIKYLSNQLDLNNPAKVRDLYNEVIEKRLFVTPVGFDYLKKLRETVAKQNSNLLIDMKPIPILSTNHKHANENDKIIARRVQEQMRKNEQALKKARKGRTTAVIFCVILAVMVIAMFAIANSSSNPNILNYQKMISDEYTAKREQMESEYQAKNKKLSEREAAVTKREAELAKKESQ